MWFIFVCRGFIGEQVDYNSQMLDNIQYQLANHPMVLDNSLFYDVFGHEGAPGQVRAQSSLIVVLRHNGKFSLMLSTFLVNCL